jgi:hypothetical protein
MGIFLSRALPALSSHYTLFARHEVSASLQLPFHSQLCVNLL